MGRKMRRMDNMFTDIFEKTMKEVCRGYFMAGIKTGIKATCDNLEHPCKISPETEEKLARAFDETYEEMFVNGKD